MKLTRTSALVLATMFLAMGPSSLIAQEDSTLAGSWKWQRESISGRVKCTMRLIENDGKLTGTYKDADDMKGKVTEVTLDDKDVTIKLILDGDDKLDITLKGKLKKGQIVGTMIDGSNESKWTAKRFVGLEDAAGKWKLSFTTPDGVERNPEFELKSDGDEPKLEFSNGDGEEEAGETSIKSVKFKDGLLIFHLDLEFQGQNLNLEYELEFLNSKELEGSMYFEFEGAGMNGDVDVTGTRQK